MWREILLPCGERIGRADIRHMDICSDALLRIVRLVMCTRLDGVNGEKTFLLAGCKRNFLQLARYIQNAHIYRGITSFAICTKSGVLLTSTAANHHNDDSAHWAIPDGIEFRSAYGHLSRREQITKAWFVVSPRTNTRFKSVAQLYLAFFSMCS